MTESELNEILESLDQCYETGDNQWTACCPHHDDTSPSLSIRYDEDTDKLLLHCFAGCEFEDIWNALNSDGHIKTNGTKKKKQKHIVWMNSTLNESPNGFTKMKTEIR